MRATVIFNAHWTKSISLKYCEVSEQYKRVHVIRMHYPHRCMNVKVSNSLPNIHIMQYSSALAVAGTTLLAAAADQFAARFWCLCPTPYCYATAPHCTEMGDHIWVQLCTTQRLCICLPTSWCYRYCTIITPGVEKSHLSHYVTSHPVISFCVSVQWVPAKERWCSAARE